MRTDPSAPRPSIFAAFPSPPRPVQSDKWALFRRTLATVDIGAFEAVSGSVAEGDVWARTGFFLDGDDEWIATVDYGDDSGVQPLSFTIDSGNWRRKLFDLSHVYSDNGTYTLTVTIEDVHDGLTSSVLREVTVHNVAP